jgi:hypothetical protein
MAAGQGSLKELAQVGRELETEPALNGDDFGIGQAGVKLQKIPQYVTGRVLPDRILAPRRLSTSSCEPPRSICLSPPPPKTKTQLYDGIIAKQECTR